jgi:2-polyprenyl-3-methyl-5-hydroxy-6-metoxy-1,4-benzoquinol methylase
MKEMHQIASQIICPICGEQLFCDSLNTLLLCKQNHKWDVISGVPRLVKSINNYASAFGSQWKRYRKTQLDSYTKTNITKERLVKALGPFQKILNQKKKIDVLEVGCGAGRFTEILLSNKNIELTSVDFSSAVEANYKNFKKNDRHVILQCDINNHPFKNNQFDFVICLGVVQHTPDPESTLKSMYELVKPGGHMIFDHYTYSLSYYTKFGSLILRQFLKRLNHEAGLKATEKLVKIFFPIHKIVKNMYFLQILLSRISPVRVYFRKYPELNDDLQFEFSFLDTHDSLTDYYKHFRTRHQLFNTLNDFGAINISLTKGGNGIECNVQKPI